MSLTPKAPIQAQKAFQALNNLKKILKNKKIFRPTDPISFWHESLNIHILFGLIMVSLIFLTNICLILYQIYDGAEIAEYKI